METYKKAIAQAIRPWRYPSTNISWILSLFLEIYQHQEQAKDSELAI